MADYSALASAPSLSGLTSSNLVNPELYGMAGNASSQMMTPMAQTDWVQEPSLWGSMGESLGNAGNFLTSDAGVGPLGVGTNLYGAYNANQLGKEQLDLQKKQTAMNQDAYNRNVASEEARKNLNF